MEKASQGSTRRGKLVVISGPSGAGKSTVCSRLIKEPRVELSVSATTRASRPGEVDGRDYYFLSRDEFERRVQQGEFLEHAEVFGNLYGTPRRAVEEAIDQGKVVLLEIDVQGALQVMEKFPQGIFIFLEPPDVEELTRRLGNRRTETDEQMRRRLETAPREMAYRDRYTHRVVNDDLDRAVEEIRRIIFDESQ